MLERFLLLPRQLSPNRMHSLDSVSFHEASQYRCHPGFTLTEEHRPTWLSSSRKSCVPVAEHSVGKGRDECWH